MFSFLLQATNNQTFQSVPLPPFSFNGLRLNPLQTLESGNSFVSGFAITIPKVIEVEHVCSLCKRRQPSKEETPSSSETPRKSPRKKLNGRRKRNLPDDCV